MALFRRKAEVVRKGVGDTPKEERKLKRVGGSTVEVRRVIETPKPKPQPQRSPRKKSSGQSGRPSRSSNGGGNRSATRSRPRQEEIILPPETARKQMLIRVLPHQTQVVVLEGPTLVEHYVAREDTASLAQNLYVAVAKNVLPGMEAAFFDFGEPKNGVLYAGDVKVDRSVHGRNPRIENMLNQGDRVLVQVVKDAMGQKGARLTGQISLPGRYLVLQPDSDAHGISRRLPDDERKRLRDIINELKPDGYGVIVRTAAASATRDELKADIEALINAWTKIKVDAEGGPAPRLVYQEPELLIRVIREHFTNDFKRLLIDDKAAMDRVIAYLEDTAPDLVSKVHMYEDELPLFERFHVEDQLRKALDRRVWLKSGGHLVIDRTEALTVIDVNTGKFVGTSNLEDTVLQNNLEAAEEICRQLRLRDIGGIIVMDFIDMESEKNQRMLIRKLKEELAKDKTRTQVFDISPLGLVEMTRKNVSRGLLENFSEPCSHCDGRGVLLNEEAATHGIPYEDRAVLDAE
ncbi:MAG: Rne/Rng family ribonuclease [Acidimicrobiia bacterium]|nr:Rne/Rng family ribonuclease [Acidimicrobiia bacterium]